MSAAARLYLRGERVVSRFAPGLQGRWAGFWLGVLSRHGLHAIDQALYDARRNYHEAEHNRRGLFPWEQTAIDEYFGERRRIAVLAAGGGREVLALARLGREPVGFECNQALVRAAAELLAGEGCPHPVHFLERDRAPDAPARFDAAIVGWSGYTLMAGRQVRVEMLRGLRRILPAGAPLLLSFFTRPDDDARTAAVRATAAGIRRLLRRPAPEPGDDMLPNFVHRFTSAEVAAEVAAGGFTLTRWAPQGPGPYDSGWAVAHADE